MNTVEFSNYLLSNGVKKKVASDIISRLKRINNELLDIGTNIDEQFDLNRCKDICESFNRKKSNSKKMLKGSSLPLDKPEIANYKYSLNKYINYLDCK